MNISGHQCIIKKISRGTLREEYTVGKDAALTLVYIVSGSSDVEILPSVHLRGNDATATIVGLVSAAQEAKIRINTLQHHVAPHTTSNLLFKSIVKKNSACAYTGSIVVEKSAQKTDAYQRNENLLMDEEATATSSPVLEILANDVRCTHGAVVKTLNEEELWYMAVRGIDHETARAMIAEGFLRSAIDIIRDESERRKIWTMFAL